MSTAKLRIPDAPTSVVCPVPLERAVDGTVIMGGDASSWDGAPGSPVKARTPRQHANLAQSGYLRPRSSDLGSLTADRSGDLTEFDSRFSHGGGSPDFLDQGGSEPIFSFATGHNRFMC